MTRFDAPIRLIRHRQYAAMEIPAIAVAAMLVLLSVIADSRSSPAQPDSENFPLSQEELRSITEEIMASQPLLSSSPGIKYAEATRIHMGSEVVADVIYYPHYESAGVKEAFQAQCTRILPDTTWTCEEITIRRYLSLETQDYEVRVRGTVDSDAAIAFIEASRKLLPARTSHTSDVPNTAMTLWSDGHSGVVTWVNFEGHAYLIVEGRLTEDGDPLRSQDWTVAVTRPIDGN